MRPASRAVDAYLNVIKENPRKASTDSTEIIKPRENKRGNESSDGFHRKLLSDWTDPVLQEAGVCPGPCPHSKPASTTGLLFPSETGWYPDFTELDREQGCRRAEMAVIMLNPVSQPRSRGSYSGTVHKEYWWWPDRFNKNADAMKNIYFHNFYNFHIHTPTHARG